MKQFLIFIRKEFLQVFRDKRTLLMLFGLPVVQILLFGFALSNEIKDSDVVVIDYSKDVFSEQLTAKIAASKYFSVTKAPTLNPKEIDAAFKAGKAKLVIIFPANFYTDLVHLKKAQVQVIADASDPNAATTVVSYITAIIQDYQASFAQNAAAPYTIAPEVRMLYNPELKSAPNFVPGVMAMILLIICAMMTSISIVREKELGTMEVLLVSPFKPILVIFSKMVPYLLISLFNVLIIFLLSVLVLGLPVRGSILLLFIESFLFIVTSLSLGLLISTQTNTQQAAMFTSLLVLMLPTMLLSGYMFPIENMPLALRLLSNLVPARWYYIIVKNVMLKGLGFASVWRETLVLFGMAIILLTLSLKSFKIRLE